MRTCGDLIRLSGIILILAAVVLCPGTEARKRKKRKARKPTRSMSWKDVEQLTDLGIDLLRQDLHRDKIAGALKLIQASKALTQVNPVDARVEAVSDFSFSHFVLSLSYLQAVNVARADTDSDIPLDRPGWERPFWETAGEYMLSFSSGDIFEVLRPGFGSWWEVRVVSGNDNGSGSLKGSVGVVPLNFVVFNRPTGVDPIADLIWAEEHGLLEGVKSDELAQQLVQMLFAGRAHLLTTYQVFVGNVPGLETFWHDLATKIAASGPTYVQQLMHEHEQREVKFKFRNLFRYIDSMERQGQDLLPQLPPEDYYLDEGDLDAVELGTPPSKGAADGSGGGGSNRAASERSQSRARGSTARLAADGGGNGALGLKATLGTRGEGAEGSASGTAEFDAVHNLFAAVEHMELHPSGDGEQASAIAFTTAAGDLLAGELKKRGASGTVLEAQASEQWALRYVQKYLDQLALTGDYTVASSRALELATAEAEAAAEVVAEAQARAAAEAKSGRDPEGEGNRANADDFEEDLGPAEDVWSEFREDADGHDTDEEDHDELPPQGAKSTAEWGSGISLMGGVWWILSHLWTIMWGSINGVFMGISILVCVSQLLTLVAHRDVLDSSSPVKIDGRLCCADEDERGESRAEISAAVFKLLLLFVVIMSVISVLPFKGLQAIITPVRELLYFNSLLSLLAWHIFIEYNMDTNLGRLQLLLQMTAATTAVLTTARFLKWDFVVWVCCSAATANHAWNRDWEDGSLSPWLWQLPAAYIALTFSPDSYAERCASCSAAIRLIHIAYVFFCELIQDSVAQNADTTATSGTEPSSPHTLKSDGQPHTTGAGGGGSSHSSTSSSHSPGISFRALRASLASGAAMATGVASSYTSTTGSVATGPVDPAAARRWEQQQAALRRRATRKEEQRLRNEKTRERREEECARRWTELSKEIVASMDLLKKESSGSSLNSLRKALRRAVSASDRATRELPTPGRGKAKNVSGMEASALATATKHRSRLQNALKRARQAEKRLLREQITTELKAQITARDIRGLEKAIRDVRATGETGIKCMGTAEKLLVQLRKQRSAERALQRSIGLIRRLREGDHADSTEENLQSVRLALEQADQCESLPDKSMGVKEKLREFLAEEQLRLQIRAAVALGREAQLKELIKSATKLGYTSLAKDASHDLAVVQLQKRVAAGLKDATSERDVGLIEHWLEVADRGDDSSGGLPPRTLASQRTQALNLARRIRKEEADARAAVSARREAELMREKEAKDLQKEVQEIRDGLQHAVSVGNEAGLSHWLALSTALLATLASFLSNPEELPTAKEVRKSVRSSRKQLVEERTEAEEQLGRFRRERAVSRGPVGGSSVIGKAPELTVAGSRGNGNVASTGGWGYWGSSPMGIGGSSAAIGGVPGLGGGLPWSHDRGVSAPSRNTLGSIRSSHSQPLWQQGLNSTPRQQQNRVGGGIGGMGLFSQNHSTHWQQSLPSHRSAPIGSRDVSLGGIGLGSLPSAIAPGRIIAPIGTIGEAPRHSPSGSVSSSSGIFGVSAAEAMLMQPSSAATVGAEKFSSNLQQSRTDLRAIGTGGSGGSESDDGFDNLMGSISSLMSDMRVPEAEKQTRIRRLQQQHRRRSGSLPDDEQ